MFIDTHLHINSENAAEIIAEAKENGVSKLIVSGCDKKGIIDVLNLINQYDNVFATIGFHPSEVKNTKEEDLSWLEDMIKNNKKVIGVGEIGLDYYYSSENREEQFRLFDSQLQLAERLDLPVVIHTRDAFQDTYNLLKKYKLNGVIHCFNGSLEVANLYINLGYALGIGGVVTFKNSKLPSIIEQIPLKSILLETDSPYLSPEPYRGKENSPKNIPIIAEKISLIKKISTKDVEKITYNNAVRLFDLR